MYKNFAKVYDKFMENCDYSDWSNFLESVIFEYNKNISNILDLGCGTGEILVRIYDKYSCDGLDISSDMLKKANIKLKNKNVNLFLGDMREFSTGKKYDLIFSFFDTINHLTSIEDLEDTFKSVYNSLEINGIYLFDVIDRNFIKKMFPGEVYADARKDFSVIWEHEYILDENVDIIEASYFIKNKNGYYDRYNEVYEKMIFTSNEIEIAIKKSGLELVKIINNDSIAGERSFYILKK